MKLSTLLAVGTASLSTVVAAQTERELDSHEHGSAIMNIAIDEDLVFLELESPWDNIVGFEHAPATEEQHALVDNAMALLNDPQQLFTFGGTECVLSDASIESTIGEDGHDDHDEDHDGDHKDGHDDHDEDHDDDHKDGHDDHDEDHDGDHKGGHDDHDEDHDGDHKDGHDDHDEDHDDDHKDGHDHDEDHDDDHKDGDGHDDHDHEEHAAETHSSVHARYSFECDDVNRLDSIDVTLLSVWSGFEELDVQMIGPGGQALVELSPQQTKVDVGQVQ